MVQAVFPSVAQATEITTSCGTDTSAFDAGQFKIQPLHGLGFYIDLKNGFNASYIGYKITNDGAAATDLWVEVANFRGATAGSSSVLSLVNPADAYQPLGSLGSGASKVIYVLVKASGTSESIQSHDAILHRGFPNGTSTIADSGAAKCRHQFTKVLRTLAASANKVTSIKVNTTAPAIGDSVVVTIQGSTGKSGSGSNSPDGDVMWLSGASSSLWPTRALRLEATDITIKWQKNTPTSGQYKATNVLLVRGVSTDADSSQGGNQTFGSFTTYTANFTFRVLGSANTNPVVKPVAQIASGTQIKHTGSYPSLATTIAASSPRINMTSVKSIHSVSSDSSSGYWDVIYKVKLTDTATAVTLDYIVDDPDTAVVYLAGSAKIIDASRPDTFVSISEPKSEVQSADNLRYIFGGPFTAKKVGANYEVELMYTMRIPVTLANTTLQVYNRAYGLIGSTIIGSSSSLISRKLLTLSIDGTPPVPTTTTDESKPAQPQEIDFPALDSGGVGQVVNLEATATSGLPVTYVSLTPSVCSVSGTTVVYLSSGTCTITASQSGNANWLAATDVTRNITIKPGQTITFAPNSPMTVSETQSVAVSATSGESVTVEVISTEVCALNTAKSLFSTVATSGRVLIQPITAGQCVLLASQAGNATYGPAPSVERVVNIGAAQYIDFTALTDRSLPAPGGLTLVAFARKTSDNNPALLPVAFTSATPDICDLTDDPTYTASGGNAGRTTAPYTYTANGICVFIATQDGFDANGSVSSFAPAQNVSRAFKIGNTTPTIEVLPLVAEVSSEESFLVDVKVTAPSSGTLSGTISLYASGQVVTADAIQEASKTANLSSSPFSVTERFTVNAGILATAAPSEEIVLTASFTTANATFTSTSTTGETMVVVIAPIPPEAVTSNVAQADAESQSVTMRGTFNPKSTSSRASVQVKIGLSSAAMDSAGVVISNPGSADGLGTSSLNVVSSKSGLTPATKYFFEVVSIRDGYQANGGVKSFVTKPGTPETATVVAGSTSVDVTFSSVSAGTGVSILYTVTCTSSSGGVTRSATGSASPITLDGLTSAADYVCRVKATSSATDGSLGGGGDGGERQSAPFTMNVAKVDRVIKIFGATSTDAESQTVTMIFGETLSAWAAFESNTVRFLRTGGDSGDGVGDGLLTFEVHSGSNCSIVKDGTSETATVTFTQTGSCAFKVKVRENGVYAETSSATMLNVTVVPADQVVTLAPLNNVNVGVNQALATSNNRSRAVDLISTGNSAICDVVAGSVRALTAGTCTVTAQSSGNVNYNLSNIASQSFVITVVNNGGGGGGNDNQNNSGGGGGGNAPARLNPSITWVDPADIFNPTPLGSVQLNAVGSVPGTLVYAPALGTVLPVGRHTLSVTLNPSDSATYNSISTTVRIRVLEQRFQTVLTWNDPAPIPYPTPLSRIQLNARANTQGIFTYNPASGTILNPGTHVLTVRFEPTLSRSFQPATTQVTILVTDPTRVDPQQEAPRPTPQNPIVVDTRPVTTPSGPGQGGGNSNNSSNSNNPNNSNPPNRVNPVILVDTRTVSSVQVTDKGRGVTGAEIKEGKVEIATAPTFSGRTTVEVTYIQNNETRVVVLPIVIPPTPPNSAAASPQSMDSSTIRWAASPNALSYEVYVRESLECEVVVTSCQVPFIVGPATPIRVVAIGGDEIKSEVKPEFSQDRVIPALTVNFATASFRLSAAFRQELRDIAEIVAREGFTSLIVYGHTDSRAYDNRTLSRQRAEATRDFLKRLLPDVKFRIAGFAATQRVAEENSRAGLAQNRRAEVRIAG